MKIINKKDIQNIDFLFSGRMFPNKIYEKIGKLKKGQGLIVAEEEWTHKSEIGALIRQVFRGSGLKVSVRRLRDETGWVIIRIR